jgi:hypothetical protein
VKSSFLFALFILFFGFTCFSQKKKEKTKTTPDTSYIGQRANRAAIFSAILPGAGQAYNKKYWKTAILYGGFAVLGTGIEYNNRYYKIFRTAYQYRIDNDTTTVDDYENIYPDDDALLLRKDYYRRTRDLLWIIGGVVYVLNIIDAYVDAHLSNFDISDDLSLKVSPALQFTSRYETVPGIGLSFSMH